MQPWVVLKTAKVDLNLNKLQNQEPQPTLSYEATNVMAFPSRKSHNAYKTYTLTSKNTVTPAENEKNLIRSINQQYSGEFLQPQINIFDKNEKPNQFQNRNKI